MRHQLERVLLALAQPAEVQLWLFPFQPSPLAEVDGGAQSTCLSRTRGLRDIEGSERLARLGLRSTRGFDSISVRNDHW
jgi:hypothetical protein